ncbi:MAG TPA: hypothetical protein VGL56_01770 [Fimbriimonadaceae bacterium]
MDIKDAQREVRQHFSGGFYGQLVSGVLWLISASLATWSTPRAAITFLVVAGFFIYPLTELLIAVFGRKSPLSKSNSLNSLGMQVAFVLPLSMPLLLPVARYHLDWFYPALAILLGAHYCPFVFMYGMPAFAALAGLLVGGGFAIAMYGTGLCTAAWFAGVVLLVFAFILKSIADKEALEIKAMG